MLGNIFKRKNKFSLQPKIGERLKITWLPNPINNPDVRSCYIGWEGIVDYLYDNGGFCINSGSAILCVISNKFKYDIINEND